MSTFPLLLLFQLHSALWRLSNQNQTPSTPLPLRPSPPPCSLLVSSLITICWHSECQSSRSRSAELLPLTAPVPGSSADSATPPPPSLYPWQAKRGCGSARNIQLSCFAQHAIHAFADDIQERQTQRVREGERQVEEWEQRELVLYWTVSENSLRMFWLRCIKLFKLLLKCRHAKVN